MDLKPASVENALTTSLVQQPKSSLQVQVRASLFLSRMKADLKREIRNYAAEARSQPNGKPAEPFEYAFESSGSLFLSYGATLNSAGLNNLRREIDAQLTKRGFDPQVVVAYCSNEYRYSIIARLNVEIPESPKSAT